jgi:hypothetical protein
MAITETKKIDKIEIVEDGSILVREATNIVKDGQVIATTYHRSSFIPGSDISAQPDNIKAIANTVWTPEVIAAYNTAQQELLARIGA